VNPEVQCIATSEGELAAWKKYGANPVIGGPPAGMQVTGFRDPAVWKEGDTWLMAVGSGFGGKGGAVLLYESKDLRHWSYLHPLVTGRMRAGGGKPKDPVDSGEMWECPDFFPLADKHLLIISTERIVKYMLGSYADRRFQPESAGIVDFGSYYAARTMANTGGRRILWGWLTESRTVDAQRAAGWSGAMSLPRELSLDGGRLRIRPAVEVGKLRGKQLGADAAGDCLEIQAEIDPGDALQAGLKLRAAPDGSEQTLVYYDPAAKRLAAEKSNSTLTPAADRKMQSGPFDLAKGEPLRLHIFLDGSVIEIFANERACLTARVYPESPQSTGLGLVARGGKAKLTSLEVWEMRPISPNRLTST